MKSTLALSALCIAFVSSFAQYTIPWATQQPAWVFPVWFENKFGEKDTIYFGYDSTAKITLLVDSQFGENLIFNDTSKFSVFFTECCDVFPDTVLKANVSGEGWPPGGSIYFIRAFVPVKVGWDVNLFRSSALPYPDQSPAPRAEGLLGFDAPFTPYNGEDCSFSRPILLTDTINADTPYYCVRQDSVTFIHQFGQPGAYLNYLVMGARQWTGTYIGMDENKKNESLDIFPNPATNNINIKVANKDIYGGFITDIYGNKIQQLDNFSEHITISISTIPNGIYFLTVFNSSTINIKKLIILH